MVALSFGGRYQKDRSNETIKFVARKGPIRRQCETFDWLERPAASAVTTSELHGNATTGVSRGHEMPVAKEWHAQLDPRRGSHRARFDRADAVVRARGR